MVEEMFADHLRLGSWPVKIPIWLLPNVFFLQDRLCWTQSCLSWPRNWPIKQLPRWLQYLAMFS